MSRLKSRHALRAHYIVELASKPTREMLRKIGNEQQQVVGYIPMNGFILTTTGEPQLQGLNVISIKPLRAHEKLSGALSRRSGRERSRMTSIVDFHDDIPWEERRALLAENGVTLLDHPNLVGNQVLVQGSVTQIQNLATWDEVAYIFPASADLINGNPVMACLGAAADTGLIGSLVQTVGDGWDGPGKGEATLRVHFQSLSSRLSSASQRSEVSRALQEWSRVAALDFEEGSNIGARKTISIVWGSGSHGDSYPFDGAGKTLAHTFYPSLPNPEPMAGDMHFDDAENWNVGSDVDVFSVALHELGHALGLAHSDVPGAVMYPYYRKVKELTKEDIDAIRGLYAAREPSSKPGSPVLPPTSGPSGPLTPETPVTSELQLELVSPGGHVETGSGTLPMNGYVVGASGTPTVRWVTDKGMYGEAIVTPGHMGRFTWSIPSVQLARGKNTVTVLATDQRRKTVGQSVEVVSSASATEQMQVPQISISSPTDGTLLWGQELLQLAGTASAARGVASVTWRNSEGQMGTALGTIAWQISNLRLLQGVNLILLTVRDTIGQEATLQLTVFRY